MTSGRELETAYRDGRSWREGPHVVYRRFAASAVEALDRPVAGLTTVDVGAGTGAVGAELAARGARVLYADRSPGMVREAPGPRLVCDIARLALRSRAFGLTAAGFVLSHVDDPAAALAELARVTRRGGTVMATSFPAGDRHPVKEAVNAALAEFGYQTPAWYERLKRAGEARVGEPAALAELARAVALGRVRVRELAAPLSGLDLRAIVAWRLGMAQVGPFLARLPAKQRSRLTVAARDAVARIGPPAPVRLLLLTGEV